MLTRRRRTFSFLLALFGLPFPFPSTGNRCGKLFLFKLTRIRGPLAGLFVFRFPFAVSFSGEFSGALVFKSTRIRGMFESLIPLEFPFAFPFVGACCGTFPFELVVKLEVSTLELILLTIFGCN